MKRLVISGGIILLFAAGAALSNQPPSEPGTYCEWSERHGVPTSAGRVMVVRQDGSHYYTGESCQPG